MDPTNLNSTFKAVIAVATLLFGTGMIVYLVKFGQATNFIHTFTLIGSFGLIFGVLIGLGFAALATIWPDLVKAKQTQ